MQEGRASPKPSQTEPANVYEAIQVEASDVVSEQGINASIQYDSPLVPESPNAAFNSPTLLGMDDETIEYTALVDSAQDQILKVTNRNDSVDKDESHNDKEQEGGNLTKGETNAIDTSHVYKPNLSAERDWVKPKKLSKWRPALEEEQEAH